MPQNKEKNINNAIKDNKNDDLDYSSKKKENSIFNNKLLNDVEIVLPESYNFNTSQNLINSFELSVYKSSINNIRLNINRYLDLKDLDKIISDKAGPGKIIVGTFSEDETEVVKKYCSKGILFFSFSSNLRLAGDCVYLVNFFPSDDLNALFHYFPDGSKVTLLYPENFYGYSINSIIDNIAAKSKSLLINRASYKEDLSNARDAIKKLGKYELRKVELERQKLILKNKNDDASKLALKKILKLETLGEVDFTHLILADYGIRLLEIAPLLPFYDVDPNKVQFVGTGAWDDKVFFDEPSLQGAIFAGIEEKKRYKFFDDYLYIYKEKPMRTATIPYDLVGLLSYLIKQNFNLSETFKLLNDSKIKFDGIDGKFYFVNNIIVRELNILKIKNGEAEKLN